MIGFIILLASAAVASPDQESAIATFTLLNTQTLVSGEFARVKTTALGTIGSTDSRVSVTWFVQTGADFPFSEEVTPFAWTIGRVGAQYALTDTGQLTIRQSLQAGVNWKVLEDEASPNVASVSSGEAAGRVSWLAVNAFTINPRDGGSVFYFYEGNIEFAPLKNGEIGLGWFYENTGGFQSGPRFRAQDFYVHVGVVRQPMVYLGVTHAW